MSESGLRNVAARRGYRLSRDRRWPYDRWHVVAASRNLIVLESATAEEAEAFLRT